MEAQEKRTDRPRFLKHLGISIATGLGIVVVAPQAVYAGVLNCCPQETPPCIECPGKDETDYFCDCPQPKEDYCLLQCVKDTGCYSGPC
jgi:hypothetical protein